MNRKRVKAYGSLMIIAAVFLTLTACSAFFLPELERTNPYDESAVVAPVENLDASVIDASTIQLSWTVPTERAPVSLAIIENRIQPPESINDGTRYDITDPAAGTWTHEAVEQEVTVYYGVWSISEDGTAVGPVHIREAINYKNIALTPELDGWVSDFPDSDYSLGELLISNDAVDWYNSLILFNLDDINTDSVATALLTLNVNYVGTGGDTLSFGPINQSWNTSIQYSTTDPDTFIDTNFSYSLGLADGFSGTLEIDVLDMVNAWLTDLQNNGIRLKGTNGASETSFSASEDSAYSPILNLEYYGDTY